MKPLQEQTLYEILEVPVDAPEAEIVKAWDRVNTLYGPGALATYTLMAPGDADLLGRRLDEAITILLDPEERKRYDARITGTPAPQAGRGEDGTGQRSSAARDPRRLPPIIRPLPRLPIPTPAPTSSEVLSTEVLAQATSSTEASTSISTPDATPTESSTPTSTEATAETSASTPTESPSAAPSLQAEAATGQAIQLSSPIAPIPLATPSPTSAAPAEHSAPLATPVPRSPPFAAMAEVKPAATPQPAPAPPPPAGASWFPPAQDLVVPEGTRFSGDVLRRAREARGLSVAQVCERTKIMRYHIENLESDRYDKLPVPVYVRGILMALAKELRLDGQKVARSYLEAMQAGLAHGAKR